MTRPERGLAAAARPAPAPAGEAIELVSPSPGLFRLAVRAGDLVHPGTVLGELEVLGRLAALVVPDGVHGAVTAVAGDGRLARPAVDFGAVLVTLEPRGLAAGAPAAGAGAAAGASGAAGAAEAAGAAAIGGRVFRAPTSGRFYGRPAPDKPPFVTAGDALAPGATICLLEVMKTFTRVTYSGEPARVREVIAVDGMDVNAGDALLLLE